jgi:predicted dehydrogenase
MNPFRVGVVGVGDISDVYIKNLQKYPIVKVLACAGRSMGSAQSKANLHGIERAYASAGDLIADPDVDIVLNLTLPAAHAEINGAALKAGKHVYTEKPLAADFEDGRALVQLARERSLVIASAPDTFLGARLQACRRLIDEGAIGDVTAVSAFVVSHGHEWQHPSPEFFYKPGAGPLLDIGPYYIVALLSLLGPAVSCSAMSKRTFPVRTIETQPLKSQEIAVDVDTHVTASIEFANGAIGTLIASFDVWDSELPRMEIYGTKGTLCLRDIDPLDGPNLFGGELLMRTESEYRWKGLPRSSSVPEWIKVDTGSQFNEVGHRANSRGIGLVDMAYAILNKRPARASGDLALHGLELMHGVLKSAKSHVFHTMTTSFARPEALPIGFPQCVLE